jgi:hypothetical protein
VGQGHLVEDAHCLKVEAGNAGPRLRDAEAARVVQRQKESGKQRKLGVQVLLCATFENDMVI